MCSGYGGTIFDYSKKYKACFDKIENMTSLKLTTCACYSGEVAVASAIKTGSTITAKMEQSGVSKHIIGKNLTLIEIGSLAKNSSM